MWEKKSGFRQFHLNASRPSSSISLLSNTTYLDFLNKKYVLTFSLKEDIPSPCQNSLHSLKFRQDKATRNTYKSTPILFEKNWEIKLELIQFHLIASRPGPRMSLLSNTTYLEI